MRGREQLEEKSFAGLKPVWDGYFADPCVIRTPHGYFAYGTDSDKRQTFHKTGREFPVLRSEDLTNWEFAGGALDIPPEIEGLDFWAPEVTFADGRYYLFYSGGGPEGQEQKLRVATADSPEGPFRGEDRPLLPDAPFSIDACIFTDPKDGQRYLFFATDFFDDPVGTGVVAAPLAGDLMSLADEPTTLLRGRADWQIYRRNRYWYDHVWPKWYTNEGPYTIFHEGKYWMLYSGGNWQHKDYGVGCAVSDSVLGHYVEPHVLEGPTVVKASKDLRGPGHSSVVVGPDGREYYCFHAWDAGLKARNFHIAVLEWTDQGPVARIGRA